VEVEDKEWTYPIELELDLPVEIIHAPIFNDNQKTMRQYGFNLALSNKMPLTRDIPDRRSGACKSIQYPMDMPKTSVIIIYFNEPLSTLLRNVMSVLNRSPPHLLGEIVLVDDNSTLEELKYLPQHLAKLPKKVPWL
jgi:polypeptide N-acetylgalactosaminyltransferase